MQRSFLIFAVAFVALMAGALFYAARAPVNNAEPAAVETAEEAASAVPEIMQYPAFNLPDVDGEVHALADFDGRHRLLNFWATWCAPCRREIPLLKEFQAEQGDDGILIIGVAVDFPEEVATYAEAAEFNYPIVVGQDEAMAVAESSGVSFMAMPFTMIIARDGEFLGAYLGELHRSHLDEIAGTLARLDAGELTVEATKGELAKL